MGAAPGTKACYAAACIFALSGFLLSGASTAIVLMIIKTERLDEQLWTTAVMIIGFSFGILCIGILFCAFAMCKRMASADVEGLDTASEVEEKGSAPSVPDPSSPVSSVRVWSTGGSLDPLLPGQVDPADEGNDEATDEQDSKSEQEKKDDG